MKQFFKITKLLFINIFIIIFLLEVLLYFYIPDEQKKLVNIKQAREKIAKEKGLSHDLRNAVEAFIQEYKKNPKLSNTYQYNGWFSQYANFKKLQSKNFIIPFRGPINKQTLSCAEDLKYRVINNDKLGFKNPNTIYKNKIDLIVLGDSIAEGFCMDENDDITGNLRKKDINAGNFAVAGTGPLVSLGVFKEYVNNFKPSFVIYMYYEGNDIKDLNWERDNTNLINYLDDNYIQNHLSRYDDIEFFLDEIFKEHLLIVEDYKLQNNASANDIEFNLKKRNNFIESLKDIAELRRLKNFYKNYILSGTNSNFDEELFFSIIKKMNEETKSWKGNFIFIYVPSWERFLQNSLKEIVFLTKEKKL